MTARLGIMRKLTTPFHLQANAAVEYFHRQLKDTLWARLARADWFSYLPWVMLGLRAVLSLVRCSVFHAPSSPQPSRHLRFLSSS
jgi:hypothetical protein